jgi:hypothetical protein
MRIGDCVDYHKTAPVRYAITGFLLQTARILTTAEVHNLAFRIMTAWILVCGH